MRYHSILAPVIGLVVAGAAVAQTPQTPQPAPAPAPAQPAPAQPAPSATPQPNQPASPAKATPDVQQPDRPVEPSQAVVRAHVDTLLEGITVNEQLRQRVDSIITAQTNIPVTPTDSMVDAATRERLATMLGQVRTAVRGVLTTGQQLTFDTNVENWRKRQRPPAS